MIIVPTLLDENIALLDEEVKRLSLFYPRFQIDIADGVFVPHTTIQISDLTNLYTLAKPEIIFDFHLMVQDPLKQCEMIKNLHGITLGTVLIHKSVFPPLSELVSNYPSLRFGLVLSPEDEVSTIDNEQIISLPALQIMTVVPGFQGSPFVEESLIKIEQLRKRGFTGEILIDGSVNENTIPIILSKLYKPDVMGVGSYLTNSPREELERREKRLKFLVEHVE